MTHTTQWYKKRNDPQANYVARSAKCADILKSIGDVIHAHDMPGVAEVLGVPVYTCMVDLFAPTEVSS